MDHKTFFQFSLLSTTKTTFINIKLIEWRKKCIKIDMYKNKNLKKKIKEWRNTFIPTISLCCFRV